MARQVDPKRTRKALAKVRKLAATEPGAAEAAYSAWEREFLSEVESRLDRFGSAFADPTKGRMDEALSRLQEAKLREIAAKAKGKPRKGLATRKPLGWRKRTRPESHDSADE